MEPVNVELRKALQYVSAVFRVSTFFLNPAEWRDAMLNFKTETLAKPTVDIAQK